MQRYLMNTTYLQERIHALHAIHKRQLTDYGELVTALNEECSILIDIIPNYKISATLDTEDGGNGRKKKEVFNVQRLEHDMLTQYEHFLQLLRRLQRKSHPEQQALGSRICARLVQPACEFNHCDKLLRMAVDFANSKSTRVAQPVIKALAELMDGQTATEATEHIVAAILDIVRKKSYAMNPKVLNLLLHIRIALVDMHRRDLTEEKAKNKRMKKEDKELARQMQKSNARRERSEIAARQTRVVHRLFVIYLRVLESSKTCSRAHQTKILAPALEGLVKFAPLVNVELYHDLLQALKDLVADENTSVTTKLHALVAVATLAQKDATATASEWRVDLSYFHEVLFQCLPEVLDVPRSEDTGAKKGDGTEEEATDDDEIASQGSTSSAGSLSSQAFSIANSMAQANFVSANAGREWTYRTTLVLRTVDLLVLTPRHLPVLRVTAILRRILQAVPLCPPHIALSLLSLSHRLMQRYPAAAGIVIGGSDNAIGGRGTYNPGAQQISSANADCCFTWEVSLLTSSPHPVLRHISDLFCKHYVKLSKYKPGQPPVMTKQLDLLNPYDVLEKYDPSLGEVNPPPPLPAALKLAAKRERAEMERDFAE